MRVLMLGIVLTVAALMPASASAEDQQIADFIKARLMQEKQQGNLFGFNVDMRVDRGTVWFKGFVSNRSQELLILRTAQLAGHLGVVQVVDDIELNNPAGQQTQAQAQPYQAAQQQQQQQPYQMQQVPGQIPDRTAMRPTQQQLPVPNHQQMQHAHQQQIQSQQNLQREMMTKQMMQRQAMPQPPANRQPLVPQSLAPLQQQPPVPTPRAQYAPPQRMNMPLSDNGSDASEDSKMPKIDEATQEVAQKVAYQEPIPAAPLSSLSPYPGQLPAATGYGGVPAQQVSSSIAPPQPIARQPVAAAQPLPFARAAAPGPIPSPGPQGCQDGFCGGGGGYGGGGYGAAPAPSFAGGGGFGGGAGLSSNTPNLPGYAWPGYAANPNYGAVSYPKQYSPSAWPYIGPFYPYPQVPLGWRKVSLEWDDGWWFLDFNDKN